jgi:ATP-dependent helicase HrpB
MTSAPLPIHAVLPDLLAALRTTESAVLIAPPGAGKTTAVAPAMAP